jgi:hypothetical protein
MKFRVLAALAGVLMVTAGCGSPIRTPDFSPASSSPAKPSATAVAEKKAPSPSPSSSPTPTPTPTPTFAKVGDVATNGGIQIKVVSAVASPTVTQNTSNYRSGSGSETYEDVPAQSGGRYVVVKAVVTNNGKAPIDLTCSYPIDIKVFNSSSQVYSPIENIYKIKDNPECNAQLQPGFESNMTWAFLVPAKSTIVGAAFSEVDFSAYKKTDPTIISFGAGL